MISEVINISRYNITCNVNSLEVKQWWKFLEWPTGSVVWASGRKWNSHLKLVWSVFISETKNENSIRNLPVFLLLMYFSVLRGCVLSTCCVLCELWTFLNLNFTFFNNSNMVWKHSYLGRFFHLDFAVTLWCYAYPDLVGRKVSYKSEICSWKIGLFSMSK